MINHDALVISPEIKGEKLIKVIKLLLKYKAVMAIKQHGISLTMAQYEAARKAGFKFAKWTDKELLSYNPETWYVGEKDNVHCFFTSVE